jgi:DNA-binding MarR family transcriptional regulator
MIELEKGYEVIKRIKRLKEGMHGNIEKNFREMKLTGPQGMVVGILFKSGSLKIGEIASQMELSMSTVSGIIDRLERSGIITRTKSEEDGRVILVKLTDDFRQKSAVKFKRIEEQWSEKLNQASEEEFNAIINGLDILEKLLMETKETEK